MITVPSVAAAIWVSISGGLLEVKVCILYFLIASMAAFVFSGTLSYFSLIRLNIEDGSLIILPVDQLVRTKLSKEQVIKVLDDIKT